jgi:Subtilase family
MAKSYKTAASPTAYDERELIVITNSDVGLRASKDSVASLTGKKVSGINTLLKTNNISLVPIFGSENRTSKLHGAAIASLQNDNINLSSYYKVNANANLDKICAALLNEGVVEAAYIKPVAEPPVMNDQQVDFATVESADAPPATPNFTARQLYLDAAPGGIDARYAWLQSGGKGNGVRIIDIEGAWRFSHEDLLLNQGGVIGGTQSTDIGWRNHGTAVTGEFGGDENAFGITGICPNANVRAVSIFGSTGSAGALHLAADALGAGDIILIELHRPGPRFAFANRTDQRGYIAIEWWPDDYAAIRYAVSKGVIVVEAGGNGAENLDDSLYNIRPAGFPASWRNPFNMGNPQSGAIIVGAGAPPPGTHGRNHGPDRSRLDFSNFGARVDVQGWGREVTTCGYGDLQGGANEDFWYTDTFSGTSSASPIIVGALGSIQGRLRARSKPLLTPATAQNLLRTTGSPQQDAPGRPTSQRIGNRPNLRQAFEVLSVGGVVKNLLKDSIKETKEVKEKDLKDAIKDIKEKEIRKEQIKEVKEKDFKDGIKDIKEGHKDGVKEIKEIKEKDKDIREIDVHHRFDEIRPTDMEERVNQLEQTVQQLSHFIPQEYRPDLHSALFQQQQNDVYTSQQDLEKNAADAKNMKDSKDMEKTREV